MGYKEQIANLRTEALYHRNRFSREMLACELEGAASSIETLLTERDAAVEELRGICWRCAHGKKWDKAPALSKMTTCEYMSIQVSGALARGGGKCKCPHWEWRGPQKEEPAP